MANWPPFPAHTFNGSAVPVGMQERGRPIYGTGPDPFEIVGMTDPNANPPFPQAAHASMPNSWQGNTQALPPGPPQWWINHDRDHEPYVEPVNSVHHNTPVGRWRPIVPDMTAITGPRDDGTDSDSSSDSGSPPFNAWAPLQQQRRGPVQMDPTKVHPDWALRRYDSDSEPDWDAIEAGGNQQALVPWIPPSPHSLRQHHSAQQHEPLYTRPSSMANFPVSPAHARKHFSFYRPPIVKRKTHRPSRGEVVSDTPVLVASRPSDWRPDYTPRSGSSLRRGISRVREAISCRGSSYTLNPLILYDSEAYPMHQDLRHEPEVIEIVFLNLPRESNQLDLFQFATSPPVDEMCLWHPRLPWYVRIQATHPNGVTLADLFVQMYDQLHEGITSNEYFNVFLTSEDREEVSNAFAQRTHGYPVLRHKGVMRIDFLGADIMFVGLSKSKDGMWKMKTKQLNTNQ